MRNPTGFAALLLLMACGAQTADSVTLEQQTDEVATGLVVNSGVASAVIAPVIGGAIFVPPPPATGIACGADRKCYRWTMVGPVVHTEFTTTVTRACEWICPDGSGDVRAKSAGSVQLAPGGCRRVCYDDWGTLDASCRTKRSQREAARKNAIDDSLSLDYLVAVTGELQRSGKTGTCRTTKSYPGQFEELPDWVDPVGSRTSSDKLGDAERWVTETFVGVAPPGYTCPDPIPGKGWSGGNMFGVRPLSDQPLEEDGGIFCRYKYSHNGQEPVPEEVWAGLPSQLLACGGPGVICQGSWKGPQWLHPDARVAAAQAPGYPAEISARLRQEYLQQMDTPLDTPSAPAGKTDLAILDSVRDSVNSESYPLPGPPDHGRALTMAAFRTACPQGWSTQCPLKFRFYKAHEPNAVASLSDLAAQIVKAVDDSRARGSNLVINLSQGIHPSLAWWDRPGENPQAPNGVLLPAFRALKAALNYASARGAITFAAAGNTDGEDANADDRSGEMLYPAAFDGSPGWNCNTKRECAEYLPRRLVYAAGGVTSDNQPLPNARLTTYPAPFVAPACNVVLDNSLPWETAAGELPVYCGTSFGAIGVSAVVAATWTYMPSATAEQVLAVVRSAGTDITTDALGCGNANCRVRMCAALAAAGAAVTCSTAAAPLAAQPNVQPFIDANAVAVQWAGANASDATDEACGSDIVYSNPDARNANSCPLRTYASALADSEILVDQPGNPGCGHCVVAAMRVGPVSQPFFLGQVDARSDSATLSSPTLQLDGRTYELGASIGSYLQHGGSFAVPLLQSTNTPATSSTGVAAFSYLLQANGSGTPHAQVDPLPVLR